MSIKTLTLGSISLALLLALGGCSDEKIKQGTKDSPTENTQPEIKEAETVAKKIESSEVIKDIESLESSPEELKNELQGDAKELIKDISGEEGSKTDFTPPPEDEGEKSTTQAPIKNTEGSAIYSKCVACHGAKAELKALGKSEVIAGWDAKKIVADLEGYKNGTINKYGMAASMKAQVASLSKEDMEAVAEYISKL